MGKAIGAILVFGLAWAFAGAARAQSAAEALAQFGLLGRWSRDCDAAAAGTNPHMIFERVQGGTGAQYRIDFGTAGFVRRTIDKIRVLSSNTVGMRLTTLPGAAAPATMDIVVMREANRYRSISSVGSDGKAVIRNGVLVANGAEIPWNHRCPD